MSAGLNCAVNTYMLSYIYITGAQTFCGRDSKMGIMSYNAKYYKRVTYSTQILHKIRYERLMVKL